MVRPVFAQTGQTTRDVVSRHYAIGPLVDVERPRANAPRVDVKQREPVAAREGRTRVGVPGIGEPPHLVHHEGPVHQGPKHHDRPVAVPANLILGCIVDMVRGPGLKHPRRNRKSTHGD